MQAALGQGEQAPAGQVDEDRGLHQAPGGGGRVLDVPQVQVEHRDRGDGEQQADRQGAYPGLRRQQPEGGGQAAGEGNAEARHGDLQALAVQAQVDHVTEDMPQQQGKAQAVQMLEPLRRNQLRTT